MEFPKRVGNRWRSAIYLRRVSKILYQMDVQAHFYKPYNPQSNGMAESGVKTAKNMLRKAAQDGTDIWLALLAFRNTPSAGFQTSPVQRLMNRRTQGMLPLITRLLQPEITRKEDIECREKRQKNMEKHGPKTTPLGQLDPGAKVWLQPVKSTESQWVPGRVLRKRSEPRSYDVQTESGAVYRRNRRHLHSADWELKPTADGRHA